MYCIKYEQSSLLQLYILNKSINNGVFVHVLQIVFHSPCRAGKDRKGTGTDSLHA